jgi:hypothetical protein
MAEGAGRIDARILERGCHMKKAILVLAFLSCQTVVAQEQQPQQQPQQEQQQQQQQQEPHYFTPVATPDQSVIGPAAEGPGTIGLKVNRTRRGFVVMEVAAKGPAERAGIRVHDIVTRLNGKTLARLSQYDFERAVTQDPGSTVGLSFMRKGQPHVAKVSVEAKATDPNPKRSGSPPGISQYIMDGHTAITVFLEQWGPEVVALSLYFTNKSAPEFEVNPSKFFLLDAEGQPMRRLSIDEVKYSIDLWVSKHWREGSHPSSALPVPQQRYTIATDASGKYVLKDLDSNPPGGPGSPPGPSSSPSEPGFAGPVGQMVDDSFGPPTPIETPASIYNQKIQDRARKALSFWNLHYFKSGSPIPRLNIRKGRTLYWAGSPKGTSGTLKVVVFVPDPVKKTENALVFQFHLE